MKTKLKCKVIISSSIDFKEFNRLMNHHKINILETENKNASKIFTVESSEDDVEEILVYTNLSWSFN